MDGVASFCVGILLAIISVVLAIESRSLLMGEGISAKTEAAIIDLVKKDEAINTYHRMFSIYESPEEILIVLIVSFREHLDTAEINNSIDRIKKSITEKFGKINYIIIQPQAEQRIGDGFYA